MERTEQAGLLGPAVIKHTHFERLGDSAREREPERERERERERELY